MKTLRMPSGVYRGIVGLLVVAAVGMLRAGGGAAGDDGGATVRGRRANPGDGVAVRCTSGSRASGDGQAIHR